MQIPFLGPSYQGRSSNIDASRCVNFFPEISSNPNTKSPINLIGTPGTKPFATIGADVIRCMHVFSGLLYVVCGTGLYVVDSTGTTVSLLYTLATTIGRVSAVNNGESSNGVGGNQILFVDGLYGYLYNVSLGTVMHSMNFTGANGSGISAFPINPSQVTYMDGYFVVSNNTMNIFVSDLYDGSSWGGLAISTASAASDKIQVPYNLHQELYIIKEYTTELFYNSGIPTTQGAPFVRRSGAVLDFGTPAPWSVARGGGAIFFLAIFRSDQSGEFAGVVMLTGYQPEVVSTEAITYRISKFSWLNSFAFTYSENGHMFYVITFPSNNATLVYDSSLKMWHERSYVNPNYPYRVNRYIANDYVLYKNKHLISSYIDGTILQFSEDIYDDDGLSIVSFVTSPYLYDKDEMDNVFISKLIVDSETGVGTSSGDLEYTDPHATLAWSDDGGHTWSSDYAASQGKLGEYAKRLTWRRLGRTRNKVFRLTMANPVKKILINAFVEGGK